MNADMAAATQPGAIDRDLHEELLAAQGARVPSRDTGRVPRITKFTEQRACDGCDVGVR